MREDQLSTLPPTRLLPSGTYGVSGEPGVIAHLRDDIGIATIVAHKGAGLSLADATHAAFGVALLQGPRAVQGDGITFIGTGPERWLAVSETAQDLFSVIGAHAALTEQSDSSLVFDLSGQRIRETLAKGLAIDLDPAVFRVGDAATTAVAHIGVTFWQVTEAPAFRFLVARSYAAAFSRFLVASAAEYGFCLDTGAVQI